jgi:hypothetical protein
MAFEDQCVEQLMLLYRGRLADSGFSDAEIGQILQQRGPEIEQWRRKTLAMIRCFVDEPFAPSHEMH